MKLMEAFECSEVEENFNQDQRVKLYGVFGRRKQTSLGSRIHARDDLR